MPPPASQTREAARMMVAAVILRREIALAVDGAAEFAAPDDQRVVEHAALLQVLDQRGRGLVGVAALRRQLARDAFVMVPAHVIELDEAHAALGQAAGENAVGGVGAGLARIGAVQLEGGRRLLRKVGQLRARRSACDTPSRTAAMRVGDLGIAELLAGWPR